MTAYDSQSTTTDGQYPTTTWGQYGLPEQNFGSGAAGSSPPSNALDTGDTNQPGQYPDQEDFTGVTLGGTGAPGTAGIPSEYDKGEVGPQPDTITFSLTTFYKGMNIEGGMEPGYTQQTTSDAISGPTDWTQANDFGYQAPAQYQMPGVAGNTPAPGDGRFQTDDNGNSHVLYGGWLKGSRPGTSAHVGGSGPGT